jgi:hypothetical protein
MKTTGQPTHIKTFPNDKIAFMDSISLKTQTGDLVEIKYKDLTLRIINSQICFYYESEDGDLILPIIRVTQLNNYMKKHTLEEK